MMLEIIVCLLLLFVVSKTISLLSYGFARSERYFAMLVVFILYWFIILVYPWNYQVRILDAEDYDTFVTNEVVIFSMNQGRDLVKSDRAWVYENHGDTSKVRVKELKYYNYYDKLVSNVYQIKTSR